MTYSRTLKELDELRVLVEDHLRKARDGVKSFHRNEDDAFWRDCKQKEDEEDQDKPNTIITARSYLALFYSEVALAEPGAAPEPDWLPWFRRYVRRQPYSKDTKGSIYAVSKRNLNQKTRKSNNLNNFELSHLPDLFLCQDLCNRFWGRYGKVTGKVIRKSGNKKNEILDVLNNLFTSPEDAGLDRWSERGEILLSDGESDSGHYFVTLHLLRGMGILNAGFDDELRVGRSLQGAREFCIEQAFYSQRGIRHKLDAFRLAFAGTAYCLYDDNPEGELIHAIVEALANCQLENGMWPASHPIFRKEKKPWHISSHEIVLCLTWLYFQPHVPDGARFVLLRIMEEYFQKWVVSTYSLIKINEVEYSGWYNDHSISKDLIVGWATAIVCHFLTGYYWVLSDWINRRVIEELGIERHARRYLVADSSPADRISTKWRRDERRAVWPDLSPYRWRMTEAESLKEETSRRLQCRWTDPGVAGEGEELISEQIASDVLAPIYSNPAARPDRSVSSILLPGKPGTRKTTLVEQVAEVLDWPCVTVPGSVIFDRGFDYLETRANEVFSLLNMLSNCVIFFDEFEEFLRERPEGARDANSQARTIAAFTTSSMLSRMQELHDQLRCLMFLATNHEDHIDPAAKRPGRIDRRIEVRHPTCERLATFLDGSPMRVLCDLELNLEDDGDLEEWRTLKSAIRDALLDEKLQNKINFEGRNKDASSGGRDCELDVIAALRLDQRDAGTIPFRYVEHMLKVEHRIKGRAKGELLKLLDDEISSHIE